MTDIRIGIHCDKRLPHLFVAKGICGQHVGLGSLFQVIGIQHIEVRLIVGLGVGLAIEVNGTSFVLVSSWGLWQSYHT